MAIRMPNLQDHWRDHHFIPDVNQEQAIVHTDGPLYLPAGPGSGKTRVLIWRTVNLIVFHDCKPETIFLSTFTEKAALQIREGLSQYLGEVTNQTGVPYDISKIYLGTVHSLCLRLLNDRRFYRQHQVPFAPSLMDDLQQYFFLSDPRRWADLISVAFAEDATETINAYFGRASHSRHSAVSYCISLFNRFSEERLNPDIVLARIADPILSKLILMYREYLRQLETVNAVPLTDLSLLQEKAVALLESNPISAKVFKHIIVDEYQDTNHIQEELFFKLASGSKNLCVTGDDDQALYRFRGANVENFVQFPQRSKQYLGLAPTEIQLGVNYRSRRKIVDFSTRFISMCDWKSLTERNFSYRVIKQTTAASNDDGPSVVATTPSNPEEAYAEIAGFVRRLIDDGKVADPNQIAFLFRSLKSDGRMSTQVRRMKNALEAVGLEVYAPRAGRFLDVDEAIAVFGVLLQIFGKPEQEGLVSAASKSFYGWLDVCDRRGGEIVKLDLQFSHFVNNLRAEINRAMNDVNVLQKIILREGWNSSSPYEPLLHKRTLSNATGLSEHARELFEGNVFEHLLQQSDGRLGRPITLRYILNRTTTVDWTLLDLFYRICGFQPFKAMLDDAEAKGDAGPISNLALISRYLSQFNYLFGKLITGSSLDNERFQQRLFLDYAYTLYRLGESELEDPEDPFPKGRIPFLTIHQSKGLEFPVVVLGSLGDDANKPQRVEEIISRVTDGQREPLDRMAEFDSMRLFYVALTRAQNLLVLAHLRGPGQRTKQSFRQMLDENITRLPQFDSSLVPISANTKNDDLSKNYSYADDYVQYLKCPRQYMLFRKFGFVASRSQTIFFDRLVQNTLQSLHQYLIDQRKDGMIPNEPIVQRFLGDAINQHYERVRLASRYEIEPGLRVEARRQVYRYWHKLKELASTITTTGVELNLPFQKSPMGRTYGLNGVVDILRADNGTTMYDIKTHDPTYILGNRALYARQFSIYAYIWEHLRGQELDKAAIILTSVPKDVRSTLESGASGQQVAQLDKWQPIIFMKFDDAHVSATIRDFGRIVDEIENGNFAAPDQSYLATVIEGTRDRFGTLVCRNCDARFSCSAYRKYVSNDSSDSHLLDLVNNFDDASDHEV